MEPVTGIQVQLLQDNESAGCVEIACAKAAEIDAAGDPGCIPAPPVAPPFQSFRNDRRDISSEEVDYCE